MKIEANKVVSLSYELTVDGDIIETVKADKPMQFIFSTGYLLPKFESHIEGKTAGDTFEFTLAAADAYGEEDPGAIVELSKHLFEVDGKIEDGLLTVGNTLPMADANGNRMDGTVEEVRDDVVVMDFNHPLAGATLHFKGAVVEVREATGEELTNGLFGERAASCSSGCGGCSGCGE
ncbi:MAG: FKBP-type peptidyl-prolyl cis-trans isomerase [Prevotellaceae bacterium]|jgi:FKBP-type peptidyl-prolyl cis-trans isomerase SlyD|nr:FKBP-type peptidyl-prolyl cis-trans isomerase [Prevotellaceae bacterium]